MARCDECKYWDRNEIKEPTDKFVIGLCKRAMPFWDASEYIDSSENPGDWGRELKPEFADRRFFAQDASDYRADVYTTPDFFCADFAAFGT